VFGGATAEQACIVKVQCGRSTAASKIVLNNDKKQMGNRPSPT